MPSPSDKEMRLMGFKKVRAHIRKQFDPRTGKHYEIVIAEHWKRITRGS